MSTKAAATATQWSRIALGVGCFLVIVLALVMGGLTLGYNQNLGSQQRFCIVATADETGSGVSGARFRGELLMKSSEGHMEYRFQYANLSSAIVSLSVRGPVAPGALDASDTAATLCGTAPCVGCDLVSVVGEVSGRLVQRCDSSTGLVTVIEAIRSAPSRYYVQVNTGAHNGPRGELRAYLIATCGTAV